MNRSKQPVIHTSPKTMTSPEEPTRVVVRRPSGGLGLRLHRSGSYANSATPHASNTIHHSWVAYAVHEPGLSVAWKGGSARLLPGSCWLVPPTLAVTYRQRGPVNHTYIVFDTEALPSEAIADIFLKVSLCQDPLVARLLTAARTSIRNTTSDDAVLGCRLVAIAHLVMEDALARCEPAERRRLIRPLVQDELNLAFDYVAGHLQDTITVDDLAHILGVSRRHCSTLFRRHCGKTPLGFVSERRIERAAALLSDSTLGITDIARRCGFANRNHLTRVFTAQMGVAPAAYRKNHRSGFAS